jgi:hypothetical protein
VTAYAGTAELARVLRLRDASGAQGTALERVLETASFEINSECNGSGTVFFGTPYPDLAVEVCLERAVEHWQQAESPFGVLGLGGDAIPVTTARDSWGRHKHKLSPLKTDWGLA